MQQIDINPKAGSARRTNANSRTKITCSNRRSPVETRECFEDLPATKGVHTITRGPHNAGGRLSTHDRYAKEAKNLP